MAIRSAGVLIVAAIAPSFAGAQTWDLQSGFAARGEYTDNYFLTVTGQQSAFTTSVSPFVTATRRTERSEAAAVLAIGGNKVFGLSDSIDYLSGLLGLNGVLRDGRSRWTGNLSFSRAPQLQSQLTELGNVLALANTNTASLSATYRYELSERWSVGATAGASDNRYENLQTGAAFLQDNRVYYGGGTIGYAYSERTQFSFLAAYSHYDSDITSSDSVTTTIGFVHQFSPRFTISVSAGGFWSNIEATQTAPVCPTTPILCDRGLVPPILITTGETRSDSGKLYGGNISYALSEETSVAAFLSENLAPSSAGTITKTDNAGATLSHRFSERLTARLGASYARQVSPSAVSDSSTTNYYTGELGVSYLLAERWKLDAGYRYARAKYSEVAGEPQSNLVFVSIGYNWPGASSTGWVGVPNTPSLPGAGPVPLSEPSTVTTTTAPRTVDREATQDTGAAPSSPEASPFDQFTIP